jgi:hypothetical protein
VPAEKCCGRDRTTRPAAAATAISSIMPRTKSTQRTLLTVPEWRLFGAVQPESKNNAAFTAARPSSLRQPSMLQT